MPDIAYLKLEELWIILSSFREDLLLFLPGDEGQIALILPEIVLIQSCALLFVRNGILYSLSFLLEFSPLGISNENLK